MNLSLPTLALSIRQPWAWAIIHAGKDVENRSVQAINNGLKRSGRFAIHAARGMTRQWYGQASEFMRDIFGIECPDACDLPRGGIIGSVEVIGITSISDSPWFFGPRGLLLRDPLPCEFIPCVGALGYFEWRKGAVGKVELVKPAKWMLPAAERQGALL